ncbi:50S ribosomal protein L28 [Brachybacterium sp. EF45031]|uniref:50S ribosomal protein L28 n=1 Tax=Brachybacterium sillae TaxID=2810536 RepID=UPI00217EDB2A|nr:50S ribosomal protein L28 [Brachybacterium sillae]MCS6712022.1 50S ribosomal protein L28 [Brachybacterium sillae]
MSRRCQVTGASPRVGRRVSHAHRRTPRTWSPNLQTRRFWVPSPRRYVRLTLSVRAMRRIDREGIDAVVAEMLARGERF